ncbi:MAG TPA: hypothetical protein VG122_16995 [Gemmata sp.]|jgi:hypothetical protein|nr:hypothetical protein [Gemmata sp.]
MPSWPTQSDYKDALQNPDTAFRDPELQVSQAERSPMGVPRARSGAFASVYKMSRGPKAVALKLFNFPNEDRASRYRAVSDYLKKLGSKKPSAMVGFEYHPEGIRVGKWWYPTLTMDWVKGKSLGEWVREAMERKVPDVAAVKMMADAWVQLVVDIQTAAIAHGDLQHDNIMVVGNSPVLVDYDGMCVPELAPTDPKKRLEQLEFGKPAYQHPARPAEKLGPHLDHFAAWVILVALRAMVVDPSLYVRFVLKTQNENLLFTPPDMATPASSILWPELLKCKDPDVREWSRMIRESLDKPFDKIPQFVLDPFDRLRKLVSAIPRDWVGIAAETTRLTKVGKTIPADLVAAADPIGRLREVCATARKDYPVIASEAEALVKSGKPIPADLKAITDDARKRVSCRDAVLAALDSGNPRATKAAFQKALLDGWAEKRLISDAETAIVQVEVLDKLKAAALSPGDGRALVKLWTADGFKVGGIPEADEYGRLADDWTKKLAAADAFIKLYSISGVAEQGLATAWKNVTAVGLHPTLIRPEHRTRGEKAIRWAPVMEQLRAVPSGDTYQNDMALTAAWKRESDIASCGEAAEFVDRVTAARTRLHKVNELKRAIDAADAGTGSEEAIVKIASQFSSRYSHPYTARVLLGDTSIKKLMALRSAVEEKPPSDRRIAAAVDELRATNLELLGRLDKVDATLAAEAAAAGRRRKALNEFAEIDRKYSLLDKQDRKWLALWGKHKELLHKRRDTEELRERLSLAVKRTEAWVDLVKALDARDMFKLQELLDKHSKLLRDYPPMMERQMELAELLGKADRVIAIQNKLTVREAVLSEDDLQFLRENHNAFGTSAKDVIVARINSRLKSDAKLVAGFPPIRVLPNGRLPLVTASWAWAGYGLVSHCLVAVDKTRHLASPSEVDQYGLLRCRIEDHTREGGGKRVVPPPGAQQMFVTIWAAVELGWTTVYGPPLHLGPVVMGA